MSLSVTGRKIYPERQNFQKIGKRKEMIDMSIGMWIMMIIGGAAGLFSTLYLVLSIFVVIFYKIYRKVRYGISLYD